MSFSHLSAGPPTVGDVELARDPLLVEARAAGGRLCRIFWLEIEVEHAFLLAAKHRENAMRRHFLKRLGRVEVVGELGALRLLLLLDLRREPAAAPHLLTQIADEIGVLREALDQNRARAFQRGWRVGNALLRVNERGRDGIGHLGWVGKQRQGQRLQAGFPGDLRLGAPLRLVGQIDVLQPRLRVRRHDLRFERIVELALFSDAAEDRGAPLLQLAQIAEPLLQRSELRVVEHAGRFLAVACDERHRRAAVQKLDGSLHLLCPHAKLFSNPLFDGFHAHLPQFVAAAQMAARIEPSYRAGTGGDKCCTQNCGAGERRGGARF